MNWLRNQIHRSRQFFTKALSKAAPDEYSLEVPRLVQNKDRRLAAFTIMQDEPEFVHAWINHYKKHVADPRDIYVLVHAPTRPDGQPMRSEELPAWHRALALVTEHHGVGVAAVHHSSAFDHAWLAETVGRFQSFLLQSYGWVLFAEADEFVLPMPDWSSSTRTLVDFVRDLGLTPPLAVRATGFEIVQQIGEPPVPPHLYCDGTNVNLSAGDLIDGCEFWYHSAQYSKTILANTSVRWQVGFHKTKGVVEEIADGPPSQFLALVHLHKADFDLALNRSRRSRARKWSQFDVEHRQGWQNRIDEVAELRAFWEKDSDTDNPLKPGRLTTIAPGIKEALR